MPDVEDGGGEALVSPVRGAKASTSGAVDVVVVRRHEEGVSSIAAGKAAAIKKGFLSANDSEQDLCRNCNCSWIRSSHRAYAGVLP